MAKKRNRVQRPSTRMPSTINPFEVHVNKKKHDVLGRKLKSDRGLPGVARGKAVKKRKKTLLVEYKNRHKSNEFVDRRFGEYDEQMSVEDKMLQRFALEKRKQHRKRQAFSLEDEDELTHLGQSLSKFDDLTFDAEDIDEEDGGEIDEEAVREGHFGGFLFKKKTLDEQGEDYRSHKEIMDEVVLQSKKKKMERQHQKEDVSIMTERLDSDWKNIRSLLLNQSKSEEKAVPPDDYDMSVKQLAFDKRANATSRLRLEEAKAKAAQSEYEKQERERMKRMKMPLTASDVTCLSADSLVGPPLKSEDSRGFLEFSLDDKEDSGSEEDESEQEKEESTSEEQEEQEGEEGSVGVGGEEEEEEEEQEEQEDDDSDEEGSESFGSDLESDEDNADFEEEANPPSPAHEFQSVNPDKEDLHTGLIPQDLYQLRQCLSEKSMVKKSDLINSLLSKVERAEKSEKQRAAGVLFSLLLDYMNSLDMSEDLDFCKFLVRPLHQLALLSPQTATSYCLGRLTEVQNAHIRQKKKTFPDFSSLMFLKIVGVIFPPSDYKHPVITPAFIILGEILAECSVKSVSDAFLGIYACSTVLEFVRDSKRYVPEVMKFLGRFLVKCDNIESDASVAPLSLSDVFSRFEDDSKKVLRALYSSLLLVKQFHSLYEGLPSSAESFEQIKTLVENVYKKSGNQDIKEQAKAVLDQMESKTTLYYPLAMQTRKPVPLRLYEPKFDEIYEEGKKPRRSDKSKMKLKYKKEFKGAVREIRKDASFLGRLQLKDQLERDAERHRKVKALEHLLSTQQGELKSEKRKKKRA